MVKTIKIGQYDIDMKCSGLTPKIYRATFGKDIIVELTNLQKYIKPDGTFTGEDFDVSVFENLAYIMAKQAGEQATFEEWLDKFEATDIYSAMDAILTLWLSSNTTTSTAKKKTGQ